MHDAHPQQDGDAVLTTGSAAMGLERRNIARATMTRPKPQAPRMVLKIIGKVNIISVVVVGAVGGTADEVDHQLEATVAEGCQTDRRCQDRARGRHRHGRRARGGRRPTLNLNQGGMRPSRPTSSAGLVGIRVHGEGAMGRPSASEQMRGSHVKQFMNAHQADRWPRPTLRRCLVRGNGLEPQDVRLGPATRLPARPASRTWTTLAPSWPSTT